MIDKILMTVALVLGYPFLLAVLLVQAVFFASVGVGRMLLETWSK